jgi:hypothetical protein
MRAHLVLPLALLLGASPATAQEGRPDPAELVEGVLVQLPVHNDVDRAARELVALGPDAVPAIFDGMVTLRGAARLAVTAAIAAEPADDVTSAIRARIEAAPPPGPGEALQRAALAALREVGRPQDLDLCLLAAKVLGDETFAPRTRELTEALDAIYARDPSLLQVVQRSWHTIEARLRTPVARTVGNTGGDGALTFLADLLARDDDRAGMLLSQLGRIAEGVSYDAAAYAADVARPYLNSDVEGIVKEAAVTLARLDDDAAIPDLIALLAEESTGLTGNVHWALGQITGLPLPADAATWAAWQERERLWWAAEARKVFRDLDHREPAVAGGAVRKALEHRLAHHSLARELTVALKHRSPLVRRAAVDGLRQLGSKAVVPELEHALEDRDPLVAEGARATLIELTGVDPLEAAGLDSGTVAALR